MKLNILFVKSAKKNIGGIQLQVLLIAKGLSRIGYNVFLASTNPRSMLVNRFNEFGKSFTISNSLLKGSRDIIKIARANNINIIQSHAFHESMVCRLVRRKLPETFHFFRVHTYIENSFILEWKKFLYYTLEDATTEFVDCYFPINDNVFNDLCYKSNVPYNKTRVITDAVEQLGPPNINENPGKPFPAHIAMVANFAPHKGHDVLIKSLSLLKNRGLKITAHLIGGGIDDSGILKRTKQQATELGISDQLEFYGYTQNIYDALKDFPIVILPSDSESTPNSILEAMALKKLVIASSVGGVPEIILDRVNGLLCPPQNPEALASVLESVFSSPAITWEDMRNVGYKTWKERYTVPSMIDQFHYAYQSITLD